MSNSQGEWIKWKLSGESWFNQNRPYVFDTWEPQGLVGKLGFDYIIRVGTTSGTVRIANINTSGYGLLGQGEHMVNVSCDEITTMTYPFHYKLSTAYSKSHTYFVNVTF